MLKAWICALVVVLACAQPTSTGAYTEYAKPQPPAKRYTVVKTVEVIATKYFIPKRSDYKTEKEYREALRMEGGKKTAFGENLRIGHVAANLQRFKRGTIIRIKEKPGFIGNIQDTGGRMIENPDQIDIFASSKEEAEKWGKRKVTVEILKPV